MKLRMVIENTHVVGYASCGQLVSQLWSDQNHDLTGLWQYSKLRRNIHIAYWIEYKLVNTFRYQ